MVKKYFREKDLSKFLNISLTSLWRLRKENKIPYIRIGKYIRYEIKAIEEWLKDMNITDQTHKESSDTHHTKAST